MRGVVRWLFENRQTGRITVAQRPNLALSVFLVLWATRLVLRPSGTAGDVLRLGASGALVWWSADELIRGVNPFRRILGLVVLAATVANLSG